MRKRWKRERATYVNPLLEGRRETEQLKSDAEEKVLRASFEELSKDRRAREKKEKERPNGLIDRINEAVRLYLVVVRRRAVLDELGCFVDPKNDKKKKGVMVSR